MFNSSRSMVTNNNNIRNSSISMIDPNRTVAGGNITLNDFQKDKSGLLTTKLKDKIQIVSTEKVFTNTITGPEMRSGFKETVKLFPEESPGANIESARGSARGKDPKVQIL